MKTLPTAIPASAGIGLRAPHYRDLLETLPAIAWLEVHSENYFGEGGAPLHYLERIRRDYALSFHGVGLSLGSTDPLDIPHLEQLRRLIARFEPGLVSEHSSWGHVAGRHLNDLLPLPYTEEALDHMTSRVLQTQDYLGRPILLENISSYLTYCVSTMPEWTFLAELSRRTDCGILLDVNNLYVCAENHGFDPLIYLAALPVDTVAEIHLAGHAVNRFNDGVLLIDTHNRPVAEEVWALFTAALDRFGGKPTLIEWDSDLPPLGVLLEEAAKAERILEKADEQAA